MSELAIKDRVELAPAVPVDGAIVRTDDVAIAKLTTVEDRAIEERDLQKAEAKVEAGYAGVRGYWRLLQISRVIAMLSLYLYLDQYEIHHKHHLKRLHERMRQAKEL